MAAILDNSRATGAGHAYSGLLEANEREWNDARARALRAITPEDVLQELLIEREADLVACGDDAAAIGAVYLSAKSDLVEALTPMFLGDGA